MKKFLFIIGCLLLNQGLQAQVVIPTEQEGMSIDPARRYMERMKKGRSNEASSKELDPLTKRRRASRSFVPQGNWFCGAALGYVTMNTNHSNLVFSGMKQADMRIHGITVQPYFGYAVGNNSIVGLRVGYSETNGKKPFFAQYEHQALKHTYRKVDYKHQYYNVEAFWRGYVPIDSKLRWALFTDVILGYQGGSGHVLSDRDEVAFRSNFSLNHIRLGIRPGVALALTNNCSLDLSFGLADVNYAFQHEKNRDGESIKDKEFRLNSLIDLANVNVGITFNY